MMKKIILLIFLTTFSYACYPYVQEPMVIETSSGRSTETHLGEIRVDSPRYAPRGYDRAYTLEVLNGLAYFVEISISADEKIMLSPGGQAYISFQKSTERRNVPITGLVLEIKDDVAPQHLVGITEEEARIPPLRDQETHGRVTITRFKRLRER
jgi:hypothetical protein